MKKLSIILMVLLTVFLLGGCGDSNKPAAGLPKDPSKMTNKQKQEFNDWQAKQDQKAWENAIAK